MWCGALQLVACTAQSHRDLLLWHGWPQRPLFAALLERGCRLPHMLPSSSLALLPCRPFQVQRLALTVSPLPFLYPCPTLNAGGDSKLYATFLPAEDPALAPPGTAPRGVSILARDLQVHRCVLPACLPTACHLPPTCAACLPCLLTNPPLLSRCCLHLLRDCSQLFKCRPSLHLPFSVPPQRYRRVPASPLPVCPQTVTFYDSKGEFAGVRRLGSGKPIEVEGMTIVAQEVLAATGLELKADPGVPLVYAGFGGELLLLLPALGLAAASSVMLLLQLLLQLLLRMLLS